MTARKNTATALEGNNTTTRRRRTPAKATDHTVVNQPEHRGVPTEPRTRTPRKTAAKAQATKVTTTLVDGTATKEAQDKLAASAEVAGFTPSEPVDGNVVSLDKAKATRKRTPKAKQTGAATVTSLPTKKAPAKKAAAKKAPAKKAAAPKVDLSQRAQRAQETRAASAGSTVTQVCQGTCGLTKPIYKFPTTGRDADGNVKRGRTCRACRDAGKK